MIHPPPLTPNTDPYLTFPPCPSSAGLYDTMIITAEEMDTHFWSNTEVGADLALKCATKFDRKSAHPQALVYSK